MNRCPRHAFAITTNSIRVIHEIVRGLNSSVSPLLRNALTEATGITTKKTEIQSAWQPGESARR
jgi:hypothetical protein